MSATTDQARALAHYAPKFCLSRAYSDAQRLAMLRAARAFNHHAEQAGQARRAFIF